MSDNDLKLRVESSEVLRRARENLLSEVSFRADKSARFDPFTIIMLISIIVQIIAVCQKRRNPDGIIADIRNARTLPQFRTRRLRRKLDALWEECCGHNTEECASNALFDAVIEQSENATDEEINEIMRLAAEVDAR
jgi:hypothetical protein